MPLQGRGPGLREVEGSHSVASWDSELSLARDLHEPVRPGLAVGETVAEPGLGERRGLDDVVFGFQLLIASGQGVFAQQEGPPPDALGPVGSLSDQPPRLGRIALLFALLVVLVGPSRDLDFPGGFRQGG